MNNLGLIFLGALLCCSLMGCAHKLPKESNVSVTEGLHGHRWGNIYFSGQPSEKAFNSLKDSGFQTVINLREKSETQYQESWEQKIVKKQGLNYYNIPFSMKDDMSDAYVEKVTSKVMQHRQDGKILIHCSSGNRVALWLGAHFKKDHKFSSQQSYTLATELGLNAKPAQDKLRSYLQQTQN